MNEQNKAPTIWDISRKAGVAKSVVSRALNGEPGVSEQSRSRVLAAAHELGYVPNGLARMRARRSGTIGVLVRDPASPFYGALLGALHERAYARGVRLLVTAGTGKADLDEEREALQSLLKLRVDGLVVCSGVLASQDLHDFVDRVPTIVAGRPELDTRIGSAYCDEEAGMGQIVNHLAGLGHRKIAVFLVPASVAPSLHIRANLAISALKNLGIEPTVLNISRMSEAGSTATHLPEQISALITPNDRWAVATLEGLPPHHNLSLTGYDGVGVYASPLLGLTTIRQPIKEIGATAIDLLLDELFVGKSPRQVSLAGELLPGRTSKSFS